jgi:hypothetical protein
MSSAPGAWLAAPAAPSREQTLRRLDSLQSFFRAVSQSEKFEQYGFVADLRVIKLGGQTRQSAGERRRHHEIILAVDSIHKAAVPPRTHP